MRDKDQIIYLLAIVLIVIGYMSAWTALMVDGFFVSRAEQTEIADSFNETVPMSMDRLATQANRVNFSDRLVLGLAQPLTFGAYLEVEAKATRGNTNNTDMLNETANELSSSDFMATGSVQKASTRDSVNDHLEILARGLNSFGELFLGLLESAQHYDFKRDSLVYVIRCRKLTWDYVTESSKLNNVHIPTPETS